MSSQPNAIVLHLLIKYILAFREELLYSRIRSSQWYVWYRTILNQMPPHSLTSGLFLSIILIQTFDGPSRATLGRRHRTVQNEV